MPSVGDGMSLEKIVEKSELLDCYGALLTARQREYLDLYYNENLTLSEIADCFRISRQAVHDAMVRGEEQLFRYESVLRLTALQKIREREVKALLALVPESSRAEAQTILETMKVL
jgi:uncharacterized protein